ncbi:unnamed protein product [Mycena citricolor]|uniref:CCHC-type domain-containing protein n=1 Tax=Mycena citricolor TaxID=2018698 RepID=A0AAD2K2S7_9AGAR|nr:unnamed protein product [Mycena citricolor]
MAYQFSRKGCFKCGNYYPFHKWGILPRAALRSNVSAIIVASLVTNLLLVRHLVRSLLSSATLAAESDTYKVAECPSLRIQSGQKCYVRPVNCGRFGHIARMCSGTSTGFFRPPPPGRALNTDVFRSVKCYRCGGPNHMAKDCLAPASNDLAPGPKKTCYKCHQEGHIARECPENVRITEGFDATACSTIPVMLRVARASVSRIEATRSPKRHLFSLPDLSTILPGGTSRQTYQEQKVLPYTRAQLYDVVSDVSSYRHFIPFCTSSTILNRSKGTPLVLEAELTVQFLALKESYVSRVTCVPLESVEAVASSATPLFKELKTTWRFAPAPSESPHATLVRLDLAYEFASPIHAAVSSSFFGQVSKLMVEAFERRCGDIYSRNH